MNLYAESSAVLGWLLDENSAADVRRSLAAAEIIVASDFTRAGGRTAIAGLALLSLDDRVRKGGKKLGLDIIPV